MEAKHKAQEEVACDIVLGLGDSLDVIGAAKGNNNNGESDDELDPLSSVLYNLDSLLA